MLWAYIAAATAAPLAYVTLWTEAYPYSVGPHGELLLTGLSAMSAGILALSIVKGRMDRPDLSAERTRAQHLHALYCNNLTK